MERKIPVFIQLGLEQRASKESVQPTHLLPYTTQLPTWDSEIWQYKITLKLLVVVWENGIWLKYVFVIKLLKMASGS